LHQGNSRPTGGARNLLLLAILAVAAASAWLLGFLNPVVILVLLIALAALLGMMFLGKSEREAGPAADVAAAQPTPSSLADELSALADLRDKGVLTEPEFEAEKAKRLRSQA